FATFGRWFRKHERRGAEAGSTPVAVFPTCYVDGAEPEIARALVRVLEHNGASVEVPADACCGMPWLDVGDLERARKKIRESLPALAAAAKAGRPILVPQPTCVVAIEIATIGKLHVHGADDGERNALDANDLADGGFAAEKLLAKTSAKKNDAAAFGNIFRRNPPAVRRHFVAHLAVFREHPADGGVGKPFA